MVEAIWVKKKEWFDNMYNYLDKLPVIVYEPEGEKPLFVVLPPGKKIIEALVIDENIDNGE